MLTQYPWQRCDAYLFWKKLLRFFTDTMLYLIYITQLETFYRQHRLGFFGVVFWTKLVVEILVYPIPDGDSTSQDGLPDPVHLDHRLDPVRHPIHLDHSLRGQGSLVHHGPGPHGLLQDQCCVQLLPIRNRVSRSALNS